jgi:hypothetical protein
MSRNTRQYSSHDPQPKGDGGYLDFLGRENPTPPESRPHSRKPSSNYGELDFKSSRPFDFKASYASSSKPPTVPAPAKSPAPIARSGSSGLPVFSTARLKPMSQATKYGNVCIVESGSLLLDFKQEKYFILVSGDSELV